MLPTMLYLLELSLGSREGYLHAQAIIGSLPASLLVWLLMGLFVHHLFAGVRVLFIDMEWGSGLVAARRTAWLVLLLVLIVLVAGVVL